MNRHPLLACAALGMAVFAGAASAQDSRPYRVGDQVCQDVWVRERGHHDRAAGTAIGAVAGAVIGNQVGRGNGRTAATIGGAIAGGAIGNHIQGERNRRDRRGGHYEQRCWSER